MITVRVYAPATVANVACGFDILGFALDSPGNELEMTLSPEPGVRILAGDEDLLPVDPQKNAAAVATVQVLRHLGLEGKAGVEISLHRKMPLGSGLGSSAANAAASVFAINELLGRPLSSKKLIPLALEGERIVNGTVRAGNVAPALLGGVVLIRSYKPLDVVRVPCSLELFCTILCPVMKIQADEACRVLATEITLDQHVIQSGNLAGLMIGIMQGNEKLIGRSLKDVIVEPIRSRLIPGFTVIKAAAMAAEALGCSIAGSGPSIFALSTSQEQATAIGEAMQAASMSPTNILISKINQSGPKILSDMALK